MFWQIKPMLAKASKPFSHRDWIFEIKWDGTRALFFYSKKEGKFKIQNRRLLDITYRYPEFNSGMFDADEYIVDGEIVVLERGKPAFRKLQEREHQEDSFKIRLLSKRMPATYIAFDLLWLNGENLMSKPIEERKEELKKIIKGKNVLFSEHIREKGEKMFEEIKKQGFEGIMAKKLGSKYEPGVRSENWLKIKVFNTVDAVVCGYTKGKGYREELFGALVLGIYENGELRYIGKVGTGFDLETMRMLKNMLDKIRDKCPFKEEPLEAVWVKPIYVVEVKFMEWTHEGELRAPVFLRLRSDKGARECTR